MIISCVSFRYASVSCSCSLHSTFTSCSLSVTTTEHRQAIVSVSDQPSDRAAHHLPVVQHRYIDLALGLRRFTEMRLLRCDLLRTSGP